MLRSVWHYLWMSSLASENDWIFNGNWNWGKKGFSREDRMKQSSHIFRKQFEIHLQVEVRDYTIISSILIITTITFLPLLPAEHSVAIATTIDWVPQQLPLKWHHHVHHIVRSLSKHILADIFSLLLKYTCWSIVCQPTSIKIFYDEFLMVKWYLFYVIN